MTLYRVIESVKQPVFSFDHAPARVENMPPAELYTPEIRWDDIGDYYGLPPDMRDWKEQIVNLTNPEDVDHGSVLRCNWLTSYDLNANRKKFFAKNPFSPLAALGIVRTRDNQLVLGIRGGEITPERIQNLGVGLYGVAPGGSVTYKENYSVNPITDTITTEFAEELGGFKILSTKFIGAFEAYRPGPIGIKFTSLVDTDATAAQIQRLNCDANRLYDELVSGDMSREEACAVLRDTGFPPDAWEHPVIITVPDDRRAIEHMVTAQSQSFAGIGAGALMLYARWRK